MIFRSRRLLCIYIALLLMLVGRAGAVELSSWPGTTVTGGLKTGETRNWEIATNPGEYLRIHAVAADATLKASVRGKSEKPVAESTSIGGTGGTAVLAWITDEPTYRLELSISGDYPAQTNFRVIVEEYRRARSDDDPGAFPLIQAGDLVARGRKALGTKQFADSAKLFQEALDTGRQIGDARVQGTALYGLGLTHYYAGERQAEVNALHRALKLQRASKQPFETALTLHNLAVVEQLLGSCREAVAQYREALRIRETIQDQRGRGYTLLGLANGYYCEGDDQQALISDLKAREVWRSLKDEVNEADTLNTLGVIYLQMGDWDGSRQALNTALTLWRKTGNRLGEGNSSYNLALLEMETGDVSAALAREQQALTLFHAVNDARGSAYVLEAMGQAYGKQGEHAKALESFEQSRTMLEKLGERYEEAYLWQALGSEDGAVGRTAEARDAFRKALMLAQQVGDEQGQAMTLFRMAQPEARIEDPSTALRDVSEAIGLVEQSRKHVLDPAHRAFYLAAKREMYALKVSLLMATGDKTGAFETSDAAHARTLLDEVSDLGKADGLRAAGRPLLAKAHDVQAHLRPDSVIIEYLVRNDASYGWAITRDTVWAFHIPPRRELDHVVRELYGALTARNERSASETLETRAQRVAKGRALAERDEELLSEMLLGPIPKRLHKTHMIIVPDGPLYLVPFALPALSSRVQISEAPSASVLLAAEAKRSSRSLTPVLVVANPETRSKPLPKLEYSERDVMALAQVVKARELQILEKDAATGAAIQSKDLSQFGLIHFAAHATADLTQPQRSGIVLADGNLSVGAIRNLHIGARLVTLSACETAAGKEVEGEGRMSLSRAFLDAGATAVLSTLWPVDDQATAAFMQSFYKALFKRRMPMAAALREAQLHMQSVPAWSDPFYWAAFTLDVETQ